LGEGNVKHNEEHWRKNVFEMEAQKNDEKWPAGDKGTFHEFKNRVRQKHFVHRWYRLSKNTLKSFALLIIELESRTIRYTS